jgi:hypothetical protein
MGYMKKISFCHGTQVRTAGLMSLFLFFFSSAVDGMEEYPVVIPKGKTV